MEYMIGCNYWGSKYGTDMWKYWDEDSVRKDLKELSKYNMRYLRVFPNWREFQPIYALRDWRNKLCEYRFADDRPIDNEFGLDMKAVEHFKTFCKIADDNGIKLAVSIVTGWMSGRVFVPPALEHLNHLIDAESISWQIKFVRGLVRNLKDIENIAAWDLGNECNCLGDVENRMHAYLWTASIRNAILSEDKSRRIMSGMHGLGVGFKDVWTIQDQGELTDILCPHPYPSPTVGGDIEPANTLRTTIIPTAQVALYSGVGCKPAMIQEQGTMSNCVCNESIAADYMRVNLWSGWANGSQGYFWWCAHELKNTVKPPYGWTMTEDELGLLKCDYSPKKVAFTMKEVVESIENMPFNKLPDAEIDVVCIIPDNLDKYNYVANASYILAKQAGLNMTFVYHRQPLPNAKLYILPSVKSWSPIGRESFLKIIEKVKAGATLLVSSSNGFVSEIEEVFGLESLGMMDSAERNKADFGGYELDFAYERKYMLRSVGAEVLAEDTDKTVILAKNKLGDGEVYYLNFPIETNAWDEVQGFTNNSYYKTN